MLCIQVAVGSGLVVAVLLAVANAGSAPGAPGLEVVPHSPHFSRCPNRARVPLGLPALLLLQFLCPLPSLIVNHT